MRSYLPTLLVLLAPCLAIHRLTSEEQFERFKQKFGKEYSSAAEERLRFEIFSANAAAVEGHNAARSSSYTRGINQFSDLTQKEWEAAFLGGYRKMGPAKNSQAKATSYEVKDLPAKVDWREEGVISAVKNQGQCGSCWAFGATEQIESYTAIASGSLVELSAQQVLKPPSVRFQTFAGHLLCTQHPQLWWKRRLPGFHPSPCLQLHPALRPGARLSPGLFLSRSLKPTTHMSPEQQQTMRIVDTTLPPSTQLPPSPATTTCLPMTRMPSWPTLLMSV